MSSLCRLTCVSNMFWYVGILYLFYSISNIQFYSTDPTNSIEAIWRTETGSCKESRPFPRCSGNNFNQLWYDQALLCRRRGSYCSSMYSSTAVLRLVYRLSFLTEANDKLAATRPDREKERALRCTQQIVIDSGAATGISSALTTIPLPRSHSILKPCPFN